MSVLGSLEAAQSSFNLNQHPFIQIGLVERVNGRTVVPPFTLLRFVASSALCFLLMVILQFPVSYLASKTFRGLSFNEKISWGSYVISLIHAPTSALAAALAVYEGYLAGVSEELFTFTTDLQVFQIDCHALLEYSTHFF